MAAELECQYPTTDGRGVCAYYRQSPRHGPAETCAAGRPCARPQEHHAFVAPGGSEALILGPEEARYVVAAISTLLGTSWRDLSALGMDDSDALRQAEALSRRLQGWLDRG